MDMKKIGELIALQRKKLGYTQDELGNILNISGKAVSKWERGLSCPDASLMNRIAVELKISIAQLLDGKAADVSLSSNALNGGTVPVPDCAECGNIEISEKEDGEIVSPYLFGNNLEHTRSGVCGGISAQMLKNRKFVGKPSAMEGVAEGWYAIGEKTFFSFGEPYTRHDEKHYHMHRKLECNAQTVSNFLLDEECGIGQHELYLSPDTVYEFAIVLKSTEETDLAVSLTGRWGKRTYAKAVLHLQKSDQWKRYVAFLSTDCGDADADLRITFAKRGCVHIGCVSLMNKDNFRGMRRDVIDAMKEIGIRVLRWPGGNFAGEYCWFDGLLPVDERAPFESFMALETQPHTLGYDFHEINTDDFIALCREIDAEPYITVNLAWNTPEENAAWVEYCNGDLSTEYGRLRAERGHPEPYNVMLWSLGNEFRYGHMEGDNSANGYSHLARENGEKMLAVCPNLMFCSSGPYPSKEWAEYSAKPLSEIAHFVSLHHYSPSPKYDDLSTLKEEYETCIESVEWARANIRLLRKQLGNDLSISLDEWNVWYGWYRPSCVADGIWTALMMHMIIGEAQTSGVGIAFQFEAVNEGAIAVTPPRVYLTAAGRALALMKKHMNGILRFAGNFAVATEKEGAVTITVVNSSYDESKNVTFSPKKSEVKATLYEGKSLLPHSCFEVEELSVRTDEKTCEIKIPPHSIAIIQY